MKILMLTPYLPYPPASGGQIRTLNLLKYLNQNHEITLVSLYKNDQEKKYASFLQPYCKRAYLCKRPEKPWQIGNIFKAVFTLLPFLIVRNYSVEARKTVASLLETEQFDAIHAETFYIMPHIPPTNIPILLVEQTIEFRVYQHFISSLFLPLRLALSLDILKLKYWETFYWKQASRVATMSEHDRAIIKSIAPDIEPVIIPNGAGDDMFVEKVDKRNLKDPILLFVGNFYWLQNAEAANFLIHKLYPRLKKVLPRIKLIIAGQNTGKSIQNIEKGVEIIDIKPDDSKTVQHMYKKATLFLAPILGPGGTRLKVLAAMASGLPIISTQTGIEGLGVKHNKHVTIADTVDEFVEQTKRLLTDEKLYYKIQENAFALVQKKYSWESISKKLEKVYKHIPLSKDS